MNFTLLVDGKPAANIIDDITHERDSKKEFGGTFDLGIIYKTVIDQKILISIHLEGSRRKKYEIDYSGLIREINVLDCVNFGSNYILIFSPKDQLTAENEDAEQDGAGNAGDVVESDVS
jgi:hypothetical protein